MFIQNRFFKWNIFLFSKFSRIYDAFNSSRPEKTIPVGPKMSQHSLHSSITSGTTFSSCLDEAVSFDFGTPFEDTRITVVPQKRVIVHLLDYS
jgi:hypothetical protein